MKCQDCGISLGQTYSVSQKLNGYLYCLNCKTRRHAEVVIRIREFATKNGLDTTKREWCEPDCAHNHLEEELLAEITHAGMADEWGVVEHLFDIALRKLPV